MASIAATELAKLGKCEALIRPLARRHGGAGLGQRSVRTETAATRRGEAAHQRYEAEVERFMGAGAHGKRLLLNAPLAVAVVGALALLLALYTN